MNIVIAIRGTIKFMKAKERFNGVQSALIQACLRPHLANQSGVARLLKVQKFGFFFLGGAMAKFLVTFS